MVYRIKGLFKKLIDEDNRTLTTMQRNPIDNDIGIFDNSTKRTYTAQLNIKTNEYGEKHKKIVFHQYLISEDKKVITSSFIDYSANRRIKNCDFTYAGKQYLINMTNKLNDKAEILHNNQPVASVCVRPFSKTVKSDSIIDPLLICNFYIFTDYIRSEHAPDPS